MTKKYILMWFQQKEEDSTPKYYGECWFNRYPTDEEIEAEWDSHELKDGDYIMIDEVYVK